jgi:enoyl-CoA hydratase/carnithine racemase
MKKLISMMLHGIALGFCQIFLWNGFMPISCAFNMAALGGGMGAVLYFLRVPMNPRARFAIKSVWIAILSGFFFLLLRALGFLS